MDVCTIADRRSAAGAEALIDELARSSPGSAVHVLLLDEDVPTGTFASASVSRLADLDPSQGAWSPVVGSHPDHVSDVLVGPFVTHLLRDRGVQSVVFVAGELGAAGAAGVREIDHHADGHDVVVVDQPGGGPSRHLVAFGGGDTTDRVLSDWPRWAEPDADGVGGTLQRFLESEAAREGVGRVTATLGEGPEVASREELVTADGRLLTPTWRGLVRAAVEAQVLDADPRGAEGSAQLEAWLRRPADQGAIFGLTRLHQMIWEQRYDLRAAFPVLAGGQAAAYVDWVRERGAEESGLRPDDLPRREFPAEWAVGSGPDDLAWGVNVAGFFRSELGLGEAARLLVSGLDAAAVPALPVQGQYVPPCRQEAEFTFGAPADAPYPMSVVCMNGDAIASFAADAGQGFFDGRYTIALWWWEVQDAFPEEWNAAFEHIDEVWVATRHIYDAIAPASPVPVTMVPLPVVVPEPRPFARADLGLPEDGFVFLFVFDYHSTAARKNPVGHVRAFLDAFPGRDDVHLVLKSINAENMPAQHAETLAAIGDDPRIVVVDRYVSADEKNALIAACDCYVSLHRSEGFGLTPAEAMALGKPVIATRYGGVLEFMDDETAFLVDHTQVRVGPGAHPYPADGTWAQPDLEQAAAFMRRVVDDPDEAARRGGNARRHMQEHHSPEAAGAAMRLRLREVYGDLQAAGRHAVPVAGLPVDPHEELAARIVAGPPAAATSGRAVKDSLRRSVGRVLAPWTAHYERIHRELLDGVQGVQRLVRDASAELDARRREEVAETLGALRRVRRRSEDQDRAIATLEQRLARAEAVVEHHLAEHRALPYIAEDRAFEQWDDDRLGAVEGFRGAEGLSEADGYRRFEDAFRGDAARVRDLQRPYVPVLLDAGPVLDCGCGRGELLDLLREAGVEARGVDGDAGMLTVARERGLDVVEADAVEHLASLPDGSLGAVTALEVIEHLPEAVLRRFLRESRRVLRPGGLLVVETVNPHVLHALKAFWLDPTHEHPLFPEVVLELCREAGFASGALWHPTGTGDVAHDRYREPAYAVVATAGPAVGEG